MNNQSEDNASNAKPEAEVVCSQNSSLDNDEAAEADQRTRFISNNHQTTSSVSACCIIYPICSLSKKLRSVTKFVSRDPSGTVKIILAIYL